MYYEDIFDVFQNVLIYKYEKLTINNITNYLPTRSIYRYIYSTLKIGNFKYEDFLTY